MNITETEAVLTTSIPHSRCTFKGNHHHLASAWCGLWSSHIAPDRESKVSANFVFGGIKLHPEPQIFEICDLNLTLYLFNK